MDDDNISQIELTRLVIEECLDILLKEAESTVTVDIVKRILFEAKAADHRVYLNAMLSALNYSDIEQIDEVALDVISEAWNYFPHRFLDGRCPIEIMIEKTRGVD